MTLALRMFALLGLFSALAAGPVAAQPACGDTLTANTTLSGDLTCTGTGLVVGADKITIDLNGFTLSGDGDPGEHGIANGLGFDGVTIKNGTIRDFDQGISIGGNAQKNVVTGVRIETCDNEAIDLHDSDFTKVTKSQIMGNNNGVRIGADGVGNVVEKSVIIGATITGAGVEIFGTGNVVRKNQLTSNGDGVRALNGPNRITGNAVDLTVQDGIAVRGGSGSELSKNTVTRALGDGIEVQDAVATRVTKNTLIGNTESGIDVDGASDGSTVAGNFGRSNGLYGISVQNAGNVLVQDNTMVSGYTGIFVVSPTTTLAKNTATAHTGYGIQVATTAIDGGGNAASANFISDCLGLVCKD